MLEYKYQYDKATAKAWVETSLTGKLLLTTPQLNKGTAFSEAERHEFGLKGKLPIRVETLEEQVSRAYLQYQSNTSQLKKNIYLHGLLDNNQVLFYALIKKHLVEMMPTIYTPIVGMRVKEFSHEFRRARGLYITHYDQDNIEEILDNRSNPDISLIVVTDGEGVLGIGDQGVGAMDIPVAKLIVYSLSGVIDPNRTLPILLDVGTNNQELLDDPLYLGVRHKRITGKAYDDFMTAFVTAVKNKFPKAFLHWEDFGRANARRNLNRFRDTICSFNDDIQGTAVVTLAALLAAVNANKSKLIEQRIVIFGAGTAGTGIADQICAAMVRDGLTETQARSQFWLIDKSGLLTDASTELTPEQQPYMHKLADLKHWQVKNPSQITFAEVIANAKPTVLIGTSAVAGAFNKYIVQSMATYVERPIIFPLSNPNEKAEATPEDLYAWTNGNVLVATGSPFEDFIFNGRHIHIAQCNNALAFPGIGQAAIAVKAKRISDEMLSVAYEALSQLAPIRKDSQAPLLPNLEDIQPIAQQIALVVAKQAQQEGIAEIMTSVEELIANITWEPHYLPYRKKIL